MNTSSTEKVIFRSIIISLAVILVILGSITALKIMSSSSYIGPRTPTEGDLYMLTRDDYSGVAELYRRSRFVKKAPESNVAEGLSVGAYYDAALIAAAADAAGNAEKSAKYHAIMKEHKAKMGKYSYLSDNMDEMIDDIIREAASRGQQAEEESEESEE